MNADKASRLGAAPTEPDLGMDEPPAPLGSPIWQQPNTNLSEQDKQDMYNYAWDFHSYSSINQALRNDQPLTGEYQALADRLGSIIDRSALPARAKLYRHVSDVPEIAQQIKAAHQNGTPWTEKGFMSTSLDPNVAQDFDIGEAEGAIDFNINIDAPKGAKALVFDGAISDRPGATEQHEVLLQRGSQFRIDNVTTGRDGRTHVEMTLTGVQPHQNLPGAPEPTETPGNGIGGAHLETHDYEGRVGDKQHITRVQTGTMPTAALAQLLGKAGETPGAHRNRQGARWDEFKGDVAKNGVRSPIFITVDPGEAPKISEGNHRRDAALETGHPTVPVEIRYYGHAEREHGDPSTWGAQPDLGMEPALDSGAQDRFNGPMTPDTAPAESPDFGFPPISIDPGVAKDYRIQSNADIKREVDYNAEQSDGNTDTAMENVADYLGMPFAEVQARYTNRPSLMPAASTAPAGPDLGIGAGGGDAPRPVATDNGGPWTVVTRPNKFGPFQKTGFGGSWQEASDHARLYPHEHSPWVVGRDDTHVATHISPKGKETHVTIAPTKEERAAAKAEEQRVAAVAKEMLTRDPTGGDWLRRTVVRDAASILGLHDLTPEEAAKALARAGWDRSAIMRRHS